MNAANKRKKALLRPYLEIKNLNGQESKYELKSEAVVIGRLAEVNDISLESDPQKLITRYMHCSVEPRNGNYWLIDNASKNGTFLKRNETIRRVQGEEKLENRDLILVLAKINIDQDPEYWEINFIDPEATEDVEIVKGGRYLEYDWIQAKLFLVDKGSVRTEIKGLSPQEHSLIRYMDQRNKNNGNVPVMCIYEELITAIWEEYSHTHIKNDITRLIWGLRKKIEADPQDPEFLQNIKGMGYRFVTKPL